MRLAVRTSARRGTILVLFALIAFGLLALAAIVLDVGLARLSQTQMQSAADTAALEGLRWRDELPPGIEEGVPLDEAQRSMAKDVAMLTFEGSGSPLIETTGGVGDLNALDTISAASLYNPADALQPNLDDAPHGDMVAGTYGPNAAYDPSERRDENHSYERRDFVPEQNGDAFLVRLRRTNDFQGLDRVSAVSSSGPPVPLLFGRGSTIKVTDESGSYYPRHHGLTVRATAIAAVQPVLSAGVARVPSMEYPLSLPGVAPFAVSRATWNELAPGRVEDVSATVTGNSFNGDVTGFFITPALLIVGQPIAPASRPSIDAEAHRFVPLFDSVAGEQRIVGFGHVIGATLVDDTLSFTKVVDLASRNATPILAGPLPADLTPADVNMLFRYLFDPLFAERIIDPLRAAALVNRYLGPE